MTQEEERCMATLREVVSELLEELYNMGIDEETVAIAAESRQLRESMRSVELLRVLRRARLALDGSAQGKEKTTNKFEVNRFLSGKLFPEDKQC